MPKTIVITGANRGIGLEFCQQYLAAGETVFAVLRSSTPSGQLHTLSEKYPDTLTLITADVTQQEDLHRLHRQLQGQLIDLLINNAGIYGERLPFGEVNQEEWMRVLQVNTIAPLMVTQALVDLLPAGAKIALISSKMGSISDNTSGCSYIYRSSKAAVNAVGKSLSHDLADKGLSVVICHPGWVRTNMGGPDALIDTQTSVTGLRKVIENLNAENSGQFFNYDGSNIDW
ncbi:SDR family oxidoreductase [Parendozoicomonas sp. Alg238-R29]|uniref:SDR family oxidoreductase n=1 Tax=Parendozoicomonas sp. Alg238-R29 TaxID=2993446 RepID=UPI00248E45CE|nr:SDR family oxidoreductase [Parendozoicomonas sp. Alg238-R29]